MGHYDPVVCPNKGETSEFCEQTYGNRMGDAFPGNTGSAENVYWNGAEEATMEMCESAMEGVRACVLTIIILIPVHERNVLHRQVPLVDLDGSRLSLALLVVLCAGMFAFAAAGVDSAGARCFVEHGACHPALARAPQAPQVRLPCSASHHHPRAHSPRATPSACLQWWNSPGHRDNIMKGDMNEVGVGYYECPGSGVYYTVRYPGKCVQLIFWLIDRRLFRRRTDCMAAFVCCSVLL